MNQTFVVMRPREVSGVELPLPPFQNRTLVFKVKCPNCASAVRAVISKQL